MALLPSTVRSDSRTAVTAPSSRSFTAYSVRPSGCTARNDGSPAPPTTPAPVIRPVTGSYVARPMPSPPPSTEVYVPRYSGRGPEGVALGSGGPVTVAGARGVAASDGGSPPSQAGTEIPAAVPANAPTKRRLLKPALSITRTFGRPPSRSPRPTLSSITRRTQGNPARAGGSQAVVLAAREPPVPRCPASTPTRLSPAPPASRPGRGGSGPGGRTAGPACG